ncbi:MAG: hypothetical protein L3J63_00385 [Geopsychrobacter sp.]|nr:hypothetical protein [Geopsychrobacter sp.]
MFLRILRLLFIVLFIPALTLAKPLTIDKEILWQGEVRLDGPVQVSAQGVLRIAAGTKIIISNPADKISVQGQLVIDGSQERPVVFATSKGWQGISFIEAAKGSRIVHAQFSDCAQALGIIATSPLIKGNSFIRCDAAIKLLRESSAEIRDNHFADNGLGLKCVLRPR